MRKHFVYIFSVLLLVTFITKGIISLLPLPAQQEQLLTKEMCTDTEQDKQTTEDNKKSAAHEEVAALIPGNTITFVCLSANDLKLPSGSALQQAFHRSVPTPPPDCL